MPDHNQDQDQDQDRNPLFVGVDFGQVNDRTAIVVVERAQVPVGPVVKQPDRYVDNGLAGVIRLPQSYQPTVDELRVRHVERLPLRLPYPTQVERIDQLVAAFREAGHDVSLAADMTGVGRPVVDLLRADGHAVLAITISGGTAVSVTGQDVVVPKRDLVHRALLLLQRDVLVIAGQHPEAAMLGHELMAMGAHLTATGHDTYNAREGQHDDIVLALCLAVWLVELDPIHLGRAGGDTAPAAFGFDDADDAEAFWAHELGRRW